MNFFSRTQTTSTYADTDRPLSISASSYGPRCGGRQHNLRFNYGLKTVFNILRPKMTVTQLLTTLNDISREIFFFFSFLYSPLFYSAALCRSQHLSKAQMGYKAHYVTSRTVCLMLCRVTTCDV